MAVMKASSRRVGFTVIEFLVALAIVAVLLAFGYSAIPRDRIQLNQATEQLARSIDKARFDAVQRNNFVMLGVRPTEYCVLAVSVRSMPFDRSQDVALLPSDPANLDCAGGAGIDVVTRVEFGSGANSALTLHPSDDQGKKAVSALTLLFDPRGVGQEVKLAGGTSVDDGEFWIRIAHDSGEIRDVNVNRYGRTDRQ